MNRWGRRLAITVSIVVLAALAYHIAFPSWTVRHRWTYEFEVDGKTHVGSGVMETTLSTGLLCGGVNGGHHCHGFKGEAVPIDLGKHGKVFALLVSPGGGDNFVELGPEQVALRLGLQKAWSKPGVDPRDTTWAGLVEHGLKAELLPEEIPMLVRFRNINDPKTIERFDLVTLKEQLGPNSRFVRATIDTTQDQATMGIENPIPWLPWPRTRRGLITGELGQLSPKPEHHLVE